MTLPEQISEDSQHFVIPNHQKNLKQRSSFIRSAQAQPCIYFIIYEHCTLPIVIISSNSFVLNISYYLYEKKRRAVRLGRASSEEENLLPLSIAIIVLFSFFLFCTILSSGFYNCSIFQFAYFSLCYFCILPRPTERALKIALKHTEINVYENYAPKPKTEQFKRGV